MSTPDIHTKLLCSYRDGILEARDRSDIPTAEQLALQARLVAEQIGHPELYALAHWCHGLVLLGRDSAASLAALASAYTYYCEQGRPVEQGRLLIGCGAMLGQLGRLEEAQQALAQAAVYLRNCPDQQGPLMALLINRADLEGRCGNYRAMMLTAHEAEQLAVETGQIAAQAEALINQAFAALFLGELADTDGLLRRAQGLAHMCGSQELVARVAANQARLATYRGELFQALRLLAQAREGFAQAQNDIEQATVAIEEAVLYERLHLPHEARLAALWAADMLEAAGQPVECLEAIALATRLALALEETQAARQAIARGQALARSDGVAPVFATLLEGYAAHPRLQKTRAQRKAALEAADAAVARLEQLAVPYEQLSIALIAADLALALRLPAANRYRRVAAMAELHGLPALEKQACIGLSRRMRPAAAYAPLRRAADIVAEQRRAMPVEALKAEMLGGQSPLYVRLVDVCRKSQRAEQAFQTLLEMKGGFWADLAAPPWTLVSDDVWVQAKAKAVNWQQELADNEQRRKAASALTEASHQAARLRPIHPLPSLEAIQASLSPDSIGVEYLAGLDRMSACVVASDEPPTWVDLGPVAEINRLLGRLALLRAATQRSSTPARRQQMTAAQRSHADTLLAALYNALLAPLTPLLGGRTLVLAPDGLLFGVPWSALHDGGDYLIKYKTVMLVPSLAVLALPQPPLLEGQPLLLGYAGDPPLEYVHRELDSIHHLFPEAHCVVPARLSDLTWTIPPRFLHIAAHSQVSSRSPLLSQISLADGPLLLADALNLSLYGSELVTLSACESSVAPGRGGVALALAGSFLTAGARAVVASLWRVDDLATALLMHLLYAGLYAGHRLPVALRNAQLLLYANGYEHPFYWAAFQPVVRGPCP